MGFTRHMWDSGGFVPPGARYGQSIGEVLCEWRLARGWSQRGLARVSGVPQSTISRMEHGQLRGIKLTTLGRLAWALKAEEAVLMALAPAGEWSIRRDATDGRGPTMDDLQRVLDPSHARAPRADVRK